MSAEPIEPRAFAGPPPVAGQAPPRSAEQAARDEAEMRAIIEITDHFEAMPLRLKTLDQMLKTPEIDWLVPRLIHRAGLMQLFGESYSGKTLVALDLALSVAAGLAEWMGMPLNVNGPQQVVYIAAEGGAPFAVHVDAWAKAHPGADLSGFYVLDGGDGDVVWLSVDPKEPVPVEFSVLRLQIELDYLHVRPALMVWDTQIDIAPFVDENSNREMVEVLRTIKSHADQCGYLSLVVHHTGHAGGRARGASGQKGKCDVMVSATPLAGGRGKLDWHKVKGAAKPESVVGYAITPVEGSEGAIVQPLSPVATAAAAALANGLDQSKLDAVVQTIKDGATTGRTIAQKTGIRRDPEVKEALIQLQNEGRIANQGSVSRPKWVVL